MKETSKLVYFTAHDNIRSRVLLKVALVKGNLALESLTLLCQTLNLIPELENVKEFL